MSDKDESSFAERELLDEIFDLKTMLDMQEIINEEQEEKLQRCADEMENFNKEKISYVNKISKLQDDLTVSTTRITSLKEKVSELELALAVENKQGDDEREKVMWLTKDNQNLLKMLEKKVHKIKKLKCQLDDERAFYAQEKARYCKVMKRRKNHSTEVQTDNSTIEDESLSLKNSSSDSTEMIRVKSLYKHQLITTCLICEKYIKLQKINATLASRLTETRKEYKKAMCNVMLEFDKCRDEYNTLLEDKSDEENTGKILKIVNRSNRLASDNAVLKQELSYLNSRLCLLKASSNSHTSKDEVIHFENCLNKNCNDCANESLHKKKSKRRRLRLRKKEDYHNSKSNIDSSSMPASTENESLCNTNYYINKQRKLFKRYKKRVRKTDANSSNCSITSSQILTQSLNSNNNINSSENLNKKDAFPSFISFSSENTVYKTLTGIQNIEPDASNSIVKTIRLGNDTDDKCDDGTNEEFNDEPAYLQVTCDEVKPFVKDGKIVQKPVNCNYDLKADLQEWLAKTPIIECSEWSKSVQGMEVVKTESAPEILAFKSWSFVSLKSTNKT